MDLYFSRSSNRRTRNRNSRKNKSKDEEVIGIVEKIKKMGVKIL